MKTQFFPLKSGANNSLFKKITFFHSFIHLLSIHSSTKNEQNATDVQKSEFRLIIHFMDSLSSKFFFSLFDVCITQWRMNKIICLPGLLSECSLLSWIWTDLRPYGHAKSEKPKWKKKHFEIRKTSWKCFINLRIVRNPLEFTGIFCW